MNGVPAVAIATAGMHEFMASYAHTERDSLDLADPDTIADIARFVGAVIDAVGADSGVRSRRLGRDCS